MAKENLWDKVITLFPFIQLLTKKDQELLEHSIMEKKVKAKELLFSYGEQCGFIPLVISGNLRVFKISESGREVTLFRAYPGDTCLLNIACRFEEEAFEAQAEAEEEGKLALIPETVYQAVLKESGIWKDFVIKSLFKRFGETLQVLEQIAFTRVDIRLAGLLKEKVENSSGIIYITQEQLAIELGTAREVVSRLLNELKQKKMVSLGRGKIEILPHEGWRNL